MSVAGTRAYARLREAGIPLLRTADAAALLGSSPGAAHRTLVRLAESELVARVHRGLWAIAPPVDPLVVPPYLTAPHASYVSLRSGLRFHGMIEQIPGAIEVVSLGRAHRVRTSVGTIAIHHIAPELFTGYAEQKRTCVIVASAEKALFDYVYLSGRRGQRFDALPELTLPRGFRARDLWGWCARIAVERDRTRVERRLHDLVSARSSRRRAR